MSKFNLEGDEMSYVHTIPSDCPQPVEYSAEEGIPIGDARYFERN